MFAVLPQDFAAQSYVWRGPPAAVEGYNLFVDAAPRRKRGFHFGFFLPPRGISSNQCPKTLQWAELHGIMRVFNLAKYLQRRTVLVGTDSFVARQQVTGLRCAANLRAQNKILRQFFWWRRQSDLGLACFYVHTHLNPADPPSRLGSFPSRVGCRDSAVERCERWKGSARPFPYFAPVPPFPWGGAEARSLNAGFGCTFSQYPALLAHSFRQPFKTSIFTLKTSIFRCLRSTSRYRHPAKQSLSQLIQCSECHSSILLPQRFGYFPK